MRGRMVRKRRKRGACCVFYSVFYLTFACGYVHTVKERIFFYTSILSARRGPPVTGGRFLDNFPAQRVRNRDRT